MVDEAKAREELDGFGDERLSGVVADVMQKEDLHPPFHVGKVEQDGHEWTYVLHADGLDLFRSEMQSVQQHGIVDVIRVPVGPLTGLYLEERFATQRVGPGEIVRFRDSATVKHAAIGEVTLRRIPGPEDPQFDELVDLLRRWARTPLP